MEESQLNEDRKKSKGRIKAETISFLDHCRHLPSKTRNRFNLVTPIHRQNHGQNQRDNVDDVHEVDNASSSKTSISLQVSDMEKGQHSNIKTRRKRILSCSSWVAIDAKSKSIKLDGNAKKAQSACSEDILDDHFDYPISDNRASFSDALDSSHDADWEAASLLSSPSISLIESVKTIAPPSQSPSKTKLFNTVSNVVPQIIPPQEEPAVKEAREAVEGLLATRVWLYRLLFDSNSIQD